jgi:tryptophan synthase alpha chain
VSLEDHLRGLRARGRKILAPYITCGFPSPELFPDLVRGVVDAGADLLEIGVPFSDPLMDGPVVQRASETALAAEMRPAATLRTMESLEAGVPFVYMTYVNPILAMGTEAFAAAAAASGAGGVIVPDLPVDEAGDWLASARAHGLAAIFLVAPTTPPERVRRIVEACRGFVYCVSVLGVTGVRGTLSERAGGVVARVREATDLPALVGVGVSTPAQAAEAGSFADGVVVGSALLKAVQEDGVEAAVRLVKEMREAMDG